MAERCEHGTRLGELCDGCYWKYVGMMGLAAGPPQDESDFDAWMVFVAALATKPQSADLQDARGVAMAADELMEEREARRGHDWSEGVLDPGPPSPVDAACGCPTTNIATNCPVHGHLVRVEGNTAAVYGLRNDPLTNAELDLLRAELLCHPGDEVRERLLTEVVRRRRAEQGHGVALKVDLEAGTVRGPAEQVSEHAPRIRQYERHRALQDAASFLLAQFGGADGGPIITLHAKLNDIAMRIVADSMDKPLDPKLTHVQLRPEDETERLTGPSRGQR